MHRVLPKASGCFIGLCALISLQNALANEPKIALNVVSHQADEYMATNERAKHHSANLDAKTEQALEAMLSGNWASAALHAQQLVDAFPDYALGHLIQAEIHNVTALSDPLLTSLPTYSKKIIDLLLEARARIQQETPSRDNLTVNTPQLPAELIQIGKHIDHVVLVDLDTSELYLFDTKSTSPQLIKKHYISSGKAGFGKLIEGDLKTPLGVYRIHGFRGDDTLPALYGSGALMLNFPNALDRSLGRTGSGIWLHGNPRSNRSRSPRSSEGCVTMANDHLLDLYQQIDIGRTEVVLAHDVQWHNQDNFTLQREQYRELFAQYRNAWINNNFNDLMAIYTADALPSAIHRARNGTTRRVSSANHSNLLTPTGISLAALSSVQEHDISIMLNPDSGHSDEKSHLVMSFELNDSVKSRVTFYWEQDTDGFWRIKREEIIVGGA